MMAPAPKCRLCKERHWGLEHIMKPEKEALATVAPVTERNADVTERNVTGANEAASVTLRNADGAESITERNGNVTERNVLEADVVAAITERNGKHCPTCRCGVPLTNAERQRGYRKRRRGG